MIWEETGIPILADRFQTGTTDNKRLQSDLLQDVDCRHLSCKNSTLSVYANTKSPHWTGACSHLVRARREEAAEPDSYLWMCSQSQAGPGFNGGLQPLRAQSIFPTCFKSSTVVPVSKKSHPSFLNDY